MDMVSGRTLSMSHLSGNISFCSIEIDFLGKQQGKIFGEKIFGKVVELLQAGKLAPMPTTPWQIEDVASAFETMSRGQHIGKFLLDWRDKKQMVPVPSISAPALLRQDRTYIVTGGLGGFGLEVAEFLVQNGAGRLLLVSRSGKAKTVSEDLRVQNLVKAGIAEAYIVDISDEASVRHCIESAENNPSLPPIGGVFHSATLYEDAPVTMITPKQIHLGLAAKAYGALHLDSALQSIDTLDHFCLFSSISNMIGNQFQSVYAAANAFLEGLVERRRQRGLPGLAVAWGALDAGFVARSNSVRDYLSSRGVLPMPMPLALESLRFLLSRPGSTNSYVMSAQYDFDTLTQNMTSSPYPQFDSLTKAFYAARSQTGHLSPAEQLAAELELDREKGVHSIRQKLCESIGATLHMEQVDEHFLIRDMGVDSIVSLQISSKLQGALGIKISVMQLIGNQTVASLSEEIATLLEEKYIATERRFL